ncbi:uncharacterized protein LOC129728356 [Wyeomyia smithii]|uniref:uncharacterized protein LOC129728356 n=1 Tax=Wyeomyia smithii TaxID=174621 RepID=UPI002467D447|nr:uncharacterized protein LOC129728356 [Wyeomyia smithii]
MAPAAASTTKKTATLKLLVTRLKDVQAQFKDIWEFVESFSEERTASDVAVRLEKIDELWEKFCDTLIEIKAHDDYVSKGETYNDERQEFSEQYYKAKSFLMDRAKERQDPPVLEQTIRANDSVSQSTTDHVRLPQIKLQTFNGDIDDWLGFRDLFTSLIHWKPDLPEVEKFHYLKGCLQGEPKSLIEPIKITSANYKVAWEMLLRRYNNSKQLKKRQIQTLFKLPTLSKESVVDLHALLETFQRVVQTLDQIVQPGDYKDLLLVNLLASRLDPFTRRGWEEHSAASETDSLKEMTDFLQRRIEILESLPARVADTRSGQSSQPTGKFKLVGSKTSFNTTQTQGARCVACKENHPLYQCTTFQGLTVAERDSMLRAHSLCRNCFKQGHHAKDCQSKYSCRNCKGRHHTLVCFRSGKGHEAKESGTQGSNMSGQREISNPSHITSTPSTQVANLANSRAVAAGAVNYSSQVLLATAVIVIEDDSGSRIQARALLDSGSESNFISTRLNQRLQVVRDKVDIFVSGIGQGSTKVKQRIWALVTANLPTVTVDTIGWPIPQGIQLADPAFGVSKGIDIVLEIESFFEFFSTGRQMVISKQLPVLHESVFGWVVCGAQSVPENSMQISCNVSTTDHLEELVTRFWACEEIESNCNLSPEEKRCEDLFTHSVKRAADGRYIVSLPKQEDIMSKLGDSRGIAYRRLLGTERRLARDEDLRKQYGSFMEEYLRLGHMRKVNNTTQETVKRCYLPHHPVIKEASTTTKVRVVFDASCKTSSGVSLNDVLLTGPSIQDDLRIIILRCRTKQIMLVADVEKMFRQIIVHQDERPLQSILWRPTPEEEVATYELNTVTYGTKPAPFLATRTLKQLAMDEEEHYPLAARAIAMDTYMDDVLTGSDNVTEATNLRIQLEALMESGGFHLRKWASNSAEVLDGIPEDSLAIQDSLGITLDPDPVIKTLGLIWQPGKDVFGFGFNIPPLSDVTTLSRRQLLSIIATLFDPLGLVGATITMAKLFMQLSWTLKDEDEQRLGWDEPLPLKCRHVVDAGMGVSGVQELPHVSFLTQQGRVI